MLIVEIFLDDIIFGEDDKMSVEFVEAIKREFKMSTITEIKFFTGLQVSQLKEGIFIEKIKYVKEILKTFSMEEEKPMGTTMVIGCMLAKEDEQ